jgi:hypothetical protein
MAFVLDDADPLEDTTAFLPTYDTEACLDAAADFCPLCEVPESYTTPTGNKPIAQLHKVIGDLQAENRLSPAGFVRFVQKYYDEKTRPQLVDVLHWQDRHATTLNSPLWPMSVVYQHFTEHTADTWMSRQEALRQTNVLLKRTANTCLTRDGPPNPNTVKTFLELSKLRESLCGHFVPVPKEMPK